MHPGIVTRLLTRHVRRPFLSGMVLLVPIAITYLIVRFIFDIVDGVLRPWMLWVLEQFGIDWSLPGPGILAAAVLIYLVGLLFAYRLGQMAIKSAQSFFLKVPFLGTIYSANRQLVESFSGTSVTGFKRVVLAHFPMSDSWSVGFLTGVVDAGVAGKLVTVYVPTAPLPNSEVDPEIRTGS